MVRFTQLPGLILLSLWSKGHVGSNPTSSPIYKFNLFMNLFLTIIPKLQSEIMAYNQKGLVFKLRANLVEAANNVRDKFNPTFLEVLFLVICALCLLKSFDELVYLEAF
jgi:hypothetical protein